MSTQNKILSMIVGVILISGIIFNGEAIYRWSVRKNVEIASAIEKRTKIEMVASSRGCYFKATLSLVGTQNKGLFVGLVREGIVERVGDEYAVRDASVRPEISFVFSF
ncbi:MAG: hypothetical protein HGB37_01025 [Candidatus Moranbacteria bacterium]|nr:hypothetical protein [Candidatus Moranbacteria bacterium]